MEILLCSDGSSDSIAAARLIHRLAPGNDFDVHVLSVTYSPEHDGRPGAQPWSRDWSLKEKQRVNQFQAELMTLLSGACRSVTMEHQHGNVVKTILQETRDREVDLLVLGARGHSLVRRMLLGSISDAVATHTDCSVLVVRPSDEDSATDSNAELELLFAYDRSSGSREAINEVMNIAWPAKSSATVFSVAAQPFPFEEDTFGITHSNWESEELNRVRCAAEQMAAEVGSQISQATSQVTRSSHAGDAIVSEAEREKSDLVVIGDAGHSLLGEWFLGSTSKYCLRHAPCSVWISRLHRKTIEDDSATAPAAVSKSSSN